jgi:oligopeptide/dipeptide ABC transporter ATP-binding protein
MMNKPICSVHDLSVEFETERGIIRAADRVSFEIARGEILGLVGESGCGKSVTALAMLRLIPSPPGRIAGGEVLLEGRNLLTMPIEHLRGVRGRDISMIFQEPMTSLSPLHRIGRQMVEVMKLHTNISDRDAWREAEEWLAKVGISEPHERLYAYPHQLSGGMRQRVMIAMALMLYPDLIIADEPTTALDVTVQSKIFDLILETKERETSMLLITHDMGVIWEMCDRVLVMYASRVVEEGTIPQVFSNPAHPYTRGLLAAVPSFERPKARLPAIDGQVPPLWNLPPGCAFADRCPHAMPRCREHIPPGVDLEPGHRAACRLYDGREGEDLP